MAHDPMTFKVRLLKKKNIMTKQLPVGSIYKACATKNGRIFLVQHPALILQDDDWTPILEREDLVRA